MHDKELVLSEEQMDFLAEMMNIGAGNSATAFTEMLGCEAALKIPMVKVLSTAETHTAIWEPSLPVACVRIDMIGDVAGVMFFIVPDKDKNALIHLAERSVPRSSQFRQSTVDFSVLTEIGNILVGVYLTAIHDFCKLNIYHSVPTIAIDMMQSLLDESMARHGREVRNLLIIENEFIVEERSIKTFLLIVPAVESVSILIDSIDQAMKVMRQGGE